jgi:endonuclease/exonuclease/phosphatase family metal-dependent hydrolase
MVTRCGSEAIVLPGAAPRTGTVASDVASIRILTWNVQNLFLPGTGDAAPDTEVAFDAKVASLAEVIDAIRPDIACLQEIGPGAVLEPLEAALAHSLPHRAVGRPDERGIRVAILSSLPLTEITDVDAFPGGVRPVQVRDEIFDDPATAVDEAVLGRMGRSALHATVAVDSTPLTVLTAHLKSKLITYDRQRGLVGGHQFTPNDEGERLRYAGYAIFRRAGEAMTVRARLDELLAAPGDPTVGQGRERAVVMCGDLNDEPAAATTQIVAGPSGSEVDLTPGSGFRRADQGDAFRLFNLAPLLPEGQRHTRIYRGRPELVDHILATHRLVNPDNVPAVGTLCSPDPLPSMGDDPHARRNEPGSDHAALHATFTI